MIFNQVVEMSSSVSDSNLEKKFQSATNTQDSIQTLSLWLMHHKAHHQKIVGAWMNVLRKAKINHRLTLFYLANDVVQNSKRKGFLLYGNSFAEVLREATLLVRDENIRQNVLRVFNIWEERGVYTAEFITELRAILVNSKVPASAPTKLLAAFKPEGVIERLRTVQNLEIVSNKKLSSINLTRLNATNAEIIQQLKDRIHGQQFKVDFDESTNSLEDLIKKMSEELIERNELILLLEQSEIYYDTQKGEAKVVANAYKNFGSRVKNLQKKLEELTSTLPSPVESPNIDAPSPMSDQELELSLPNENEQTKELENLENAPSPVGSPVGLDLPSEPKQEEAVAKKDLGNPIPTLSNFFGHDHGGMSSWLDTFHGKKAQRITPAELPVTRASDPSSLDSRLSNLMKNIPNLPSGLQNTLFGTSSGNATPPRIISSPIPAKKVKQPESSMGLPTNKEECSGQNTPLQDEDTQSSSHTFFSKLASSNKTHSPKDILKGLTNLIQSATADKEEKKYYTPTDMFDPPGGMTSFIKNTAPPVTPAHSAYYTMAPSYATPERTLPNVMTTSANSYQTAEFGNIPSYVSVTSQGNHMSFIPSLVPSLPHNNNHYGYSTETFPSDEYNPEMEIFDTDMDIENEEEDDDDIPSPIAEPLSPVANNTVISEVPRAIGGRRTSTLVTIITKDSPDPPLPVEEPYPSDNAYKSDKENETQESPVWKEPDEQLPNPPADNVKDSPNEEFFIGKSDSLQTNFYTSAPPPVTTAPNNRNFKSMDAVPHNRDNRVETLDCYGEGMNGRWFGNDWSENNGRNMPPEPQPPFYHRDLDERRFFDNNQNFQRPNFRPRGNWGPRFQQDAPFHEKRNFPYPPRQFGSPPGKRFPFRGRGWDRQRPHY